MKTYTNKNRVVIVLLGALIFLIPYLFLKIPNPLTKQIRIKHDLWREEKYLNSKDYKNIIKFVNDSWSFKLGSSVSEIRENLGAPEKIDKFEKDSPYYDEKDCIIVIYYPGLIIRLFESGKTKNQYVKAVEIFSNKYQIKNGIKIGMPKQKVRQILKVEYSEQGSALEVSPESTSVIFEFLDNDRLKSVTWWFHVE